MLCIVDGVPAPHPVLVPNLLLWRMLLLLSTFNLHFPLLRALQLARLKFQLPRPRRPVLDEVPVQRGKTIQKYNKMYS